MDIHSLRLSKVAKREFSSILALHFLVFRPAKSPLEGTAHRADLCRRARIDAAQQYSRPDRPQRRRQDTFVEQHVTLARGPAVESRGGGGIRGGSGRRRPGPVRQLGVGDFQRVRPV